MIKTYFKAINPEEEHFLDSLQAIIGDRPNIAWYPSAGSDFRDLLEVNRTQVKPDIFFHTDYFSCVKHELGVVYNDDRTKVIIENITELEFRKKVNYVINQDYVDFPNDTYPHPKVFLLDMFIQSDFGELRKPVIYFYMENINFLDEFLLKNKIKLSHLIKVREGCGMGGNRKSISVAYALLGTLNVKYIIADSEEHTDFELINSIVQKHHVNRVKYNLKKVSTISEWSGFAVCVFEIIIIPESIMSKADLNKILRIISLCKN